MDHGIVVVYSSTAQYRAVTGCPSVTLCRPEGDGSLVGDDIPGGSRVRGSGRRLEGYGRLYRVAGGCP
ncbi:hypothetical protein [Dysgonomonas reticulitermitis]